ncbi:MAG TPA: TlpA disulfide reductase family protein [Myxococcales bacterium LLY-WYZ-16_1]|nr:TlpA disulfide reductase family protein [Myxococcales bacterium LLY-WYZ-16_1]
MNENTKWVWLMAGVLLAACAAEDGNDDTGSSAGNDMGTSSAADMSTAMDLGATAMDLGDGMDMGRGPDMTTDPDMGGDPPSCDVPMSGYGIREGSNFIEPESTTRCDGTPYAFYGEDEGYCDFELTVVIRAAEWCGPCQREAEDIGNGALDEYEGRVRFLTVIDQNQAGRAPDSRVCNAWESAFSLDREEVDHVMLMDPTQEVAQYFAPGRDGYPGNVIVDNRGVIVAFISGYTPQLSALKSELDRLLED